MDKHLLPSVGRFWPNQLVAVEELREPEVLLGGERFKCRDSEFLVHAHRWIAGGPTSLSVFVVIRPRIEVDAEPDLAAGLVVPPPDIDDKAPALILAANGSSHEHRGQSVAGHSGRHQTTRVSLLNCDPP